jgi:hypothetical protein
LKNTPDFLIQELKKKLGNIVLDGTGRERLQQMQSSELCNLPNFPKMQAVEIYNLLRVHEKTSKENALRKAWSVTHSSCKDVIALAFPLKPVPHSLDAFRNKVAGNQKQQDFVMASFYVIHVGRCDGQQHGWSKAPYDSKNKKREEQKPLYTVDTTGESKDHTRFWSFNDNWIFFENGSAK